MIYKILLTASMCCVFAFTQAQERPDARRAPSAYQPGESTGRSAVKEASSRQSGRSKRKSSKNFHDQKVEEFNKLMLKNQKKYDKLEREARKAQYSDPSYFGHKRPPKKRPAGKKKFCKECGLWH